MQPTPTKRLANAERMPISARQRKKTGEKGGVQDQDVNKNNTTEQEQTNLLKQTAEFG